jgi:phage antirepressor YoqD-like protein
MLRGMQIPSVSSACSAAIVSLGGAVREAGAAREWLDMVEREYGLLLAMARLAAEQAETLERQQEQLALQAPAVAFVDKFVEAKSSKNLSDVAKIIGWKPRAFIAKLAEEKIIFKRSGSWIPYQEHIDMGRFTVKAGNAEGHAFHQTRVEPKGIEWLAGRFG